MNLQDYVGKQADDQKGIIVKGCDLPKQIDIAKLPDDIIDLKENLNNMVQGTARIGDTELHEREHLDEIREKLTAKVVARADGDITAKDAETCEFKPAVLPNEDEEEVPKKGSKKLKRNDSDSFDYGDGVLNKNQDEV